MQVRGDAAPGWSRGARITVTALLLVLPVSCVALAVTAPSGDASGWWWLALLNAVLPTVILPFVWRRPAPSSGSQETAYDPEDDAPADGPLPEPAAH